MHTIELKLRKIGNSYGAIFPAETLKALNISGKGGKILLSVNNEGIGTISTKTSAKSPFDVLKKFESAWIEPESAVETAEKLKSENNNKTFAEW